MTILPEQELSTALRKIGANETPIWKHWGEFVEKQQRTGKSDDTIGNVRDSLRFVIRHLEIFSIEELNAPSSLEDKLHISKERRGFGFTTLNTYIKNVNTYVRWLEKRSYVSENYVKKAEKCKEPQNEQITYSQEQVMQILGWVSTRRQTKLERLRNVLFIHLLRFTGARPCELLAIQLKDIQQHKSTYKIVLQGKKQKGRARYYECTSDIRHALEMYLSHRNTLRPENPHLFISSSKPSGWTKKGVVYLMRRLSEELGFRVKCYGFRRFVATTLHNEGVPLQQIAHYLGHTRITTTLRYIESSCALTADSSRLLGQMFQENLHRIRV